MNPLHPYAVLSGDLVASQRLSATELDGARAAVRRAAEQIAQWQLGAVPLAAEFHRGDSWQLLLADETLALRAALFVRAELSFACAVDTRVAIGLGRVDDLQATLALSSGSAFVRSGKALDKMRQERLALALPSELTVAPWVALVVRLCDALASSWTRRQAQLMASVLAPDAPTQAAIGAALQPPVSKQAVGKTLRAAHWEPLALALQQFEQKGWSSDLVEPINQ